MSLFFRDFTRPDPGLSPDAPRKKGLFRWLEVVGRDMGRFWAAGALALLSLIPLFPSPPSTC